MLRHHNHAVSGSIVKMTSLRKSRRPFIKSSEIDAGISVASLSTCSGKASSNPAAFKGVYIYSRANLWNPLLSCL